MAKSVTEPGRQVPVAGEYNVIVVGGGPAGIGAALAAARSGMKTLIVEQFNCLGGIATAGGHAHMSTFAESGTRRQIVRGVAHEITGRIVAARFGHANEYGIWFQIEGLKLILEQMAQEAGVEFLYYTQFCSALVEGGVVRGVIVQNKAGRQAYLAKRVVDCTGDGDVGASAGCPFEIGRPGDGKCQPVTLMFTIGGCNWKCIEAARPDFEWKELWAEAQRNGDMEPFQSVIMGWWWTPSRPD